MSSLLGAFNASASALDAQRARIEVAVSNIANAESTRGPDGQPYRRRDVVLGAQPQSTPSTRRSGAPTRSACRSSRSSRTRRRSGAVTSRRTRTPTREGFVALPNVDVPEEMVDMLGAARAYQANLTAIGLIRDTISKRARAREISHGHQSHSPPAVAPATGDRAGRAAARPAPRRASASRCTSCSTASNPRPATPTRRSPA